MRTACVSGSVLPAPRRAARKRGGREHGFSQQFVGKVLSGRRAPSDRILRGLGLQAGTVFVPRAPEEVAFYDGAGVTLLVAQRVFD